MTNYYSMMLDITGQLVVVVGGGKVATRKVASLLQSQAKVTVISPELSPKLKHLAEEKSIKWREKEFTRNDLDGALLVIAATNSSAVNELVAESSSRHQLVNIVDREELSQFIVPSVLQRGPLTISVSTSGANPSLAKKIKQDLAAQYDDVYEEYILFLQKARQQIINEVADSKYKSQLLKELLEPQFLTLTRSNQIAEREALFKQLLLKGTIQ